MSESTEPIKLTDKAAIKIRELLGEQEDGSEQALRVAVRGGGCSGFQYALAFDSPKEDDHRFENQGVAVVVDKT
ncbi:MAG TPA: iron-sulfur cluster assembly accessory protein, partial [Solirubrobacterales bacterium]